MRYLENPREANLEDLAKIVDNDGKRVYSEHLLEELNNGNHIFLNELSLSDRENRDFMEPLLYAMKNDPIYGTYIAYRYYGENLQEDLGLLIEVVLDDPEIIEGTPISKNREFMLDIVEIKPSAILYVDDTLKKDPEFIEELKELQDKGVDKCVALLENPELASNPEFMKEAIIEDAKFLEFASEELKNDYEFMKEVTKQNYAAVEYVIQKRDDFGLEGIKGAQETTKELTIEDYMAIIDDMAEKSEDDRYKRVRDVVHKKGPNAPYTVKIVAAMAAQNRDNISIENFKKLFDYGILTMTKIQKDLTENGEIKISKENAYELITPRILNELKEAAIAKGLEITPEQEAMFKEYEEFHKEYNEKLREKKKQEREKAGKTPEDTKESQGVTPQNIEKVSEDVKLSEVQEETTAIREGVTIEKEAAKETEEIGEI